MTRVWIVQSGEYEQRGIDGVFSSLQAAISGTKERFGAPYRVKWYRPVLRGGRNGTRTLVGDFEAVPGYSTQHRAEYDIEPWDLDS